MNTNVRLLLFALLFMYILYGIGPHFPDDATNIEPSVEFYDNSMDTFVYDVMKSEFGVHLYKAQVMKIILEKLKNNKNMFLCENGLFDSDKFLNFVKQTLNLENIKVTSSISKIECKKDISDDGQNQIKLLENRLVWIWLSKHKQRLKKARKEMNNVDNAQDEVKKTDEMKQLLADHIFTSITDQEIPEVSQPFVHLIF